MATAEQMQAQIEMLTQALAAVQLTLQQQVPQVAHVDANGLIQAQRDMLQQIQIQNESSLDRVAQVLER
eukprot:5735522-Heterocapsa_arctica.AAC.1